MTADQAVAITRDAIDREREWQAGVVDDALQLLRIASDLLCHKNRHRPPTQPACGSCVTAIRERIE